MIRAIAIAFVVSLPGLGLANEFQPVKEKATFLSLVQDRELRIGVYSLALSVLPDGQIKGSAMGWAITGQWSWQDGYFCREMDWSGMEIPYNCQLVEATGDERLRFTVDKGTADSATFRLR